MTKKINSLGLKFGVQNRLCSSNGTNLELKLLIFEIPDGICEANNFVDFIAFETNDGVEFSNLFSNGVENVIKIKAKPPLTIVAVIFSLLTLNTDQADEAHRQNQLRERNKIYN